MLWSGLVSRVDASHRVNLIAPYPLRQNCPRKITMMGRASSYEDYYFLLFLVCFLLLIYAYSVKPEIESVFGCFCFVCFRCYLPYREDDHDLLNNLIGPLHDLVTWYGVNYARTLIAQWDFQNNETCVPSKLIPYHVTGSCKGPNGLYHFNSLIFYSFAIVGLRQSF